MFGILNYILISVGLLMVAIASMGLLDLLNLGGGIGGGMALVAMSRVITPVIIISLIVII
jgi:hypothetical protein